MTQRICIFGASGATGLALIEQAVVHAHDQKFVSEAAACAGG